MSINSINWGSSILTIIVLNYKTNENELCVPYFTFKYLSIFENGKVTHTDQVLKIIKISIEVSIFLTMQVYTHKPWMGLKKYRS